MALIPIKDYDEMKLPSYIALGVLVLLSMPLLAFEDREPIAKHYIALDCSFRGSPEEPILAMSDGQLVAWGSPKTLPESKEASKLLENILQNDYDVYIDPACFPEGKEKKVKEYLI